MILIMLEQGLWWAVEAMEALVLALVEGQQRR